MICSLEEEEDEEEGWMVSNSPMTVVDGPAACDAPSSPSSSWMTETEEEEAEKEEGGAWVSKRPSTVAEG
jgi:hypothetical protein